ncbi:MAG: EAL domain-containing protein, partial [Prochlorothrix sp.]
TKVGCSPPNLPPSVGSSPSPKSPTSTSGGAGLGASMGARANASLQPSTNPSPSAELSPGGLPSLPDLFVGVNISAKQFQQIDFLQAVDQVLATTHLSPQHLKLEVTESLLLDQHDRVVETLTQLRSRQIRVSVDDFGTGYSSLSYLKRFPLDTLKVDQSFVRELDHSQEDARIVEAIVTLSHNLGLDVVAEGVETLEQLIYLRQLGCEAAQGYLFAQPLPAAEALQLIHQAMTQPLLDSPTWIPST